MKKKHSYFEKGVPKKLSHLPQPKSTSAQNEIFAILPGRFTSMSPAVVVGITPSLSRDVGMIGYHESRKPGNCPRPVPEVVERKRVARVSGAESVAG